MWKNIRLFVNLLTGSEKNRKQGSPQELHDHSDMENWLFWRKIPQLVNCASSWVGNRALRFKNSCRLKSRSRCTVELLPVAALCWSCCGNSQPRWTSLSVSLPAQYYQHSPTFLLYPVMPYWSFWPGPMPCAALTSFFYLVRSSLLFVFLYSLVFFRILSFFSSFFELTSQFLSLPPFVPFSLIFSSIPFLRFDSLLVLRIRLNAIIVYNAAQSPLPPHHLIPSFDLRQALEFLMPRLLRAPFRHKTKGRLEVVSLYRQPHHEIWIIICSF